MWGNDAPRSTGSARESVDPGNPDVQETQAQPQGPLAGNQPQAIDNPVGTAEPQYDQYEVNQPQNMHQLSGEEADRVRRQAAQQENALAGFGYGADGEEEMADAPDVSESEDGADPAEARGNEARGPGDGGEAAKAEYDKR